MLNIYPINIIPRVVIPKNIANNFQLIAFFKINASGMENVTVAVMKANAVPSGTPLSIKASITGITLTEFAYRGMPRSVAAGTTHHAFMDRYFSIRDAGIYP